MLLRASSLSDFMVSKLLPATPRVDARYEPPSILLLWLIIAFPDRTVRLMPDVGAL